MRVLVINTDTNFYNNAIKEDGKCDVVQMFKPCKSKISNGLRKLHYISRFPGFSKWYNCVRNVNFKDYDCIIIYARRYVDRLYAYIKKRTDAKIVFWYNNTVQTEGVVITDLGIPKDIVYSFDQSDCQKYGFKFNPQFYCKYLVKSASEITHDVLFVGQDKGRADSLIKLEEYLNGLGQKTYFYIKSKTRQGKSFFNKDISYEQAIDLIAKSRIVIDWTAQGQVGLTWRPLEALFFDKKLITNNSAIKTEKLYNQDNVAIVDINQLSIDKEWLNAPYTNVDESIIDYYGVQAWIDRFN